MANRPTIRRSNLTQRQREIYEFLQDAILRQGYGPTVREIGNEFGIRSPNGVLCHLDALAKKGMISRQANISRSIQIRDKARPSTELELRGELGQTVPLSPVSDALSQVDFMALLGCGDHFCYRVSDDSLESEKICAGDFLICREQKMYRDGDRVLLEFAGGNIYFNRFIQEFDDVQLEPTNDPTTSFHKNPAKILGLVLGVIRKL